MKQTVYILLGVVLLMLLNTCIVASGMYYRETRIKQTKKKLKITETELIGVEYFKLDSLKQDTIP